VALVSQGWLRGGPDGRGFMSRQMSE
jgi:hypothetical protein